MEIVQLNLENGVEFNLQPKEPLVEVLNITFPTLTAHIGSLPLALLFASTPSIHHVHFVHFITILDFD